MKRPKLELSKGKAPKVPKGVGDVYRELRNQRLLPVVAVLIVGLIAIPVLLGGASSSDSRAKPHTPAGSAPVAALSATTWNPSLLDYRKRLGDRSPTDPFTNQIYDRPSEGPAEEGTGAEPPAAPEITIETPGEVSSGEIPSELPEVPSEGRGDEKEGGGKPSENEEESPAEMTIDVKVTSVHAQAITDKVTTRHDQPQLSKLPSDAVPALTYVGPSEDGRKAMMVVSPEVTALLGNSKCIVKAAPCQLLALELDAPETIVFGDRGLTYRIELTEIGSAPAADARRGSSSGSPADEVGLGQAFPVPAG